MPTNIYLTAGMTVRARGERFVGIEATGLLYATSQAKQTSAVRYVP